MKKSLIMAAMALLTAACMKQINPGEPGDNWNGYQKYLKIGEQVHTLWAGKNINVGTVFRPFRWPVHVKLPFHSGLTWHNPIYLPELIWNGLI